MFVIISDLAKIQEELLPYPSHENKTLQWQSMYHNSLSQLIKDLDFDEKNKEKIQRTESLLFQLYDSFHKYSKCTIVFEEKELRLQHILQKHQVEQRTAQWYEDMKIMLTASEFSKLFDSERTRGTLVLSKVNPVKRDTPKAVPTLNMYPMDWGIRFEPIVKQYLEKQWDVTIYDCGRLKHGEQKHLGASPDGIITTITSDKYARLVEIKCPYSRKVGLGIPFDYWVQMQIQLEVTNLYECEYVEVEIFSKTSKNLTPDFTGFEISKLYLMEKEGVYIYVYDDKECAKKLLEEYAISEVIEYAITKVHNELVQRDTIWYESTKEKQEKFWEDVEKARNNDFVLVEPKYKKVKPCLIDEEIG